MTKISGKLDPLLLEEIENDRKQKGMKFSEWLTNAAQNYLSPALSSPEADHEIGQLKKLCGDLSAERNDLKKELARTRKENENISSSKQASARDLEELETRLSKVQSERDKITADLSNQKVTHDHLQKDHIFLTSEFAQLKGRYDDILHERDTLTADNASIRHREDRLRIEYESRETDISRHKRQIRELEEDCESAKGLASRQKKESELLIAEKGKLEADLLEQRKINTVLYDDHTALTNGYSALKDSCETLEKECTGVSAELGELKVEYDNLNARFNIAIQDLNNVTRDRDAALAEREQLRSEINASNGSIITLNNERERCSLELSSLKTALAEVRSEQEMLTGRHRALQDINKNVVQENNELAAESDGLKKNLVRIEAARELAEQERNTYLVDRQDLEKQIRYLSTEAELSKAKNFIIDELRKDKEFLQSEFRKMGDRTVPALLPPRLSFWDWFWGER